MVVDMKKLLFLLFCMFFLVTCVYGKKRAYFKECVDGDTIKLVINGEDKTVRLLAVDTPETVKPNSPLEYYGKEASEFTCNMVMNAKVIELEYEDSNRTDKYNRVLAWVFLDGVLLQDELVKGGYASVAYLYGKYKYNDLLLEHESISKINKVGIFDDEKRDEFNNKNSNDNDASSSYIDEISVKDVFILIGLFLVGNMLRIIYKKYLKMVRNVFRLRM